MELGSLIGLVVGLVFTLLSMYITTDYDFVKFGLFADGPSVLITVGGSFCATLLANPLVSVIAALKAVKFVFKPPKVDPTLAINQIIQLSNLARKEGLLELEETARAMEDPFLLKGVMLIADGADAELVHNVLETEMNYIEARHGDVRGVFEFLGSSGPAWGMIGTLIGLIVMLADLNDPSTLGPKMAVAIITTFYGSILANFLAIPIANKLKIFSSEEILIKEVQVEGMLSILNGENPRNIEEKLKAFVSPAIRNAAGAKKEDAGRGGDED